MQNEKILDDRIIQRDRSTRLIAFFVTVFLVVIGCGLLGGFLLYFFFGHIGFFFLGLTLGSGSGFLLFLSLKHKFVVRNGTLEFLMTHDPLQSIFGKSEPYTIYGPGTHFCFPWETRSSENVFTIAIASEDFHFTANCIDGTIIGRGSYRLRPDPLNPRAFLASVNVIGQNTNHLIQAFIVHWIAGMTIDEALATKNALNLALQEKFATGKSEFENRFGVQIVDIIVSEIRLTEKVERTRNALNEADSVVQGAASLLGFKNVTEMNQALKIGTIKQENINQAMRDFLVVSGKSKATTKRFEIDFD